MSITISPLSPERLAVAGDVEMELCIPVSFLNACTNVNGACRRLPAPKYVFFLFGVGMYAIRTIFN